MSVFLAEAEEILVTIEQSVIVLETAPGDRESIDAVFRAAHTLKGNAASLGFDGVSKLAHGMEDLLDQMRAGRRAATTSIVTLLLRSGDALRRTLQSEIAGRPEDVSTGALLAELRRAVDEDGDEVPAAAGLMLTRELAAEAGQSRHLRVSLDRLDMLLNLTGELSIATGKLFDSIAHLPEPYRERLLHSYVDVERSLAELQEEVTSVRMVPIGPRFDQHNRTVRDLAQASSKPLRLVIEARDVEIDASLVEHIKDPLTHMIRNAIDHGVESPDERQAAGKDPVATITLRAYYDGGGVVIQVVDDGKGFDRERILARARETGMLFASHMPSDEEIFSCVFAPGFSTAEQVTEMSGRGVGMDVVNRNILALRGRVSVTSENGKGSTISIRLPLTLAILDGLAVGAGGERFVVPMQAIRRCMAMPAGYQRSDVCGIVDVQDAAIPFIRLARLFELDGEAGEHGEQVVVVEADGATIGLVTDVLIGEMQAVLKPLGTLFRELGGVAASTIFADGRVGLVIDVGTLVRMISATTRNAA